MLCVWRLFLFAYFLFQVTDPCPNQSRTAELSQSGLWSSYFIKLTGASQTHRTIPILFSLIKIHREQFGARATSTSCNTPSNDRLYVNTSLPALAVNVRGVIVHQMYVGQRVGAAAAVAATRHRTGEEEDCWFRPLSLELGSAQGEIYKPTSWE